MKKAPAHIDAQRQAVQNLVPCPAEPPTLIDRFDGRALIDPIPKGGWEGQGDDGAWGECSAPKRREEPLTQRQKAEQSLAAYEAYKDLLKHVKNGHAEQNALELTRIKFDTRLGWEAEEEERRREKHNMPGLPPNVLSYQVARSLSLSLSLSLSRARSKSVWLAR